MGVSVDQAGNCGASGEIYVLYAWPGRCRDRRTVTHSKDAVAGNSNRFGDGSLRIQCDDFTTTQD